MRHILPVAHGHGSLGALVGREARVLWFVVAGDSNLVPGSALHRKHNPSISLRFFTKVRMAIFCKVNIAIGNMTIIF